VSPASRFLPASRNSFDQTSCRLSAIASRGHSSAIECSLFQYPSNCLAVVDGGYLRPFKICWPLAVKSFYPFTEIVGLPQPTIAMPFQLDRDR
jgi:hypothetical protein